jgi:hypothetical protein
MDVILSKETIDPALMRSRSGGVRQT